MAEKECIEREAVVELFNKWADGYRYIEVPTKDAIACVRAIPAADVRPVVRGKWEKMSPWSEGVGMGESYGYYYSCSECEKQVQGGYKTCGFAYCPNCGAVMGES